MSGGGVRFPISSTMVPIPTVLMPTVLRASLPNAAAISGKPRHEHHARREDPDVRRRIVAGVRRNDCRGRRRP